jgi:starch phosphorylase
MSSPSDLAPLRPVTERILDTLLHRIAKDERAAKPHDWLSATIFTIRDQVIDQWMASTRAMHAAGTKRVYYLSLEFLIGRLLRDALSNLRVTNLMPRWAMAALAAWRPVSWKAWHRWACPPAATASVM